MNEHFAYIMEIIHKHLKYPPKAKRQGWTGKVRVSFVILENGGVTDVRGLSGSGYEILDADAVDTINEAAPYPKPPIKATLTMPITYHLEQ